MLEPCAGITTVHITINALKTQAAASRHSHKTDILWTNLLHKTVTRFLIPWKILLFQFLETGSHELYSISIKCVKITFMQPLANGMAYVLPSWIVAPKWALELQPRNSSNSLRKLPRSPSTNQQSSQRIMPLVPSVSTASSFGLCLRTQSMWCYSRLKKEKLAGRCFLCHFSFSLFSVCTRVEGGCFLSGTCVSST